MPFSNFLARSGHSRPNSSGRHGSAAARSLATALQLPAFETARTVV